MLSLKRSIHELEDAEERFHTAAECYVSAIRSVEEFDVTVDTGWSSSFHKELKSLCRKLAGEAQPDVLKLGVLEFRNHLSQHCDNFQQFLDGKDRDIQDIVDVLTRLSKELGSHADEDHVWLVQFGNRLKDVARLRTLAEVKAELNRTFAELTEFSEHLQRNTKSSIQEMRQQVESYKARLAHAEALAATDPLTGVVNRREGERLLAERIQAGEPFCVLMLDLNGFKSINDRFGHLCGDQVLKTFASRLSQHTRSEDVVCRWGGDEFLVILGCSLDHGVARARDLSMLCSEEQSVTTGDRTFSILVGCSVGIADRKAGESIDDLILRADQILYQQKRTTKTAC
jgi:diguanylate cyclase (GGDEF)-like protein